MALSQTGKKVLLVDTDLRKPVLHRIFHCKRGPGIVNVLVEDDWKNMLGKALRQTQSENLTLLPCGHVPPNPNEMLGSDKMGQVIDLLAQQYEFVLFDSPPLLTVSDAMVLAQRVEGVLLVVRGGFTTKASLRNTVEHLRKANTDIMGVVLNDVDFSRERYYYAYHYKYYKSYYAYGEEGEKASGKAKHAGRKKQGKKGDRRPRA